MTKSTRLQLFGWSFGTALSITGPLAYFSKAIEPTDIQHVRDAIANLPPTVPFLIAAFILILIVAYSIGLSFQYNVVPQTGHILSRDGVLSFDREQHIAISVATLKSLFVTLASETEEERANDLLYRAGEAAGKRFGDAFSEIYRTQLEPHGSKPWDKCSDDDKLDAWERYDATVGWGRIGATKYEKRSTVDVVFRHPTLYSGAGGALFSWILAGYSKEVASALLGKTLQFDGATGLVHDKGILKLHFTY